MGAPHDEHSLFADLRSIRAPLRWALVAARKVIAFCMVVGAITFVLHAILFFTALHYGSLHPTGGQIYRITDHADSRYVTYPIHECLKVLSITMVIGLAIGIVGEALFRCFLRWLRPSIRRGDRP